MPEPWPKISAVGRCWIVFRAPLSGRTLRGFSGLGLVPLVLIFLAAAVAVWLAGIQLSDSTEALDSRLGLGEALGGVILLAVATNLPEIAITASAALAHDLGIAIGNILGGIAIQTVVLVALDVAMGPESALTTRAASLVLGLEGLLVIVVLAISVMGAQLPSSNPHGRLEPAALLIALPDLETAFRVLDKIAKLEVFETETFPAEEVKVFWKTLV